MLYTVDRVNSSPDGTVLPPGVRMGAYILDDCDKDTYGLQQAVEFIKGDDEGGSLSRSDIIIRGFLEVLTDRASSAVRDPTKLHMQKYWEYSVSYEAQALNPRIDAYAGQKNALVLLAPDV